jgi:hypothetical protein
VIPAHCLTLLYRSSYPPLLLEKPLGHFRLRTLKLIEYNVNKVIDTIIKQGNIIMDASNQSAFKKRLKVCMNRPENAICVDCPERQPRWASLIKIPGAPSGTPPIGAFMCLECSGSHRRLGVHIAFVRSINLDSCKFSNCKMFVFVLSVFNSVCYNFLRCCCCCCWQSKH